MQESNGPIDVIRRLRQIEDSHFRLRRSISVLRAINALLIVIVITLGLAGSTSLKPIAAQQREAAPPEIVPPPVDDRPFRVGSSLESRTLQTEFFIVKNRRGKCVATFTTPHGMPTLCFNSSDETNRLWFDVDEAGEPGIVLFDKGGGNPVRLSVDRSGEPKLLLKKFVRPPARPEEIIDLDPR